MKHNLRVDEEDFFLQNKVVIVEILDSPQILTIFGISEKKRVALGEFLMRVGKLIICLERYTKLMK